jgi:hypothetical protein
VIPPEGHDQQVDDQGSAGAQSLRGHLWAAVALAFLLTVAALLLGLTQVGGHYDSESFDCGSPFLSADGESGYEGTEQYRACEQERDHSRWVALIGIGFGLALIGSSTATLAASKSKPVIRGTSIRSQGVHTHVGDCGRRVRTRSQ